MAKNNRFLRRLCNLCICLTKNAHSIQIPVSFLEALVDKLLKHFSYQSWWKRNGHLEWKTFKACHQTRLVSLLKCRVRLDLLICLFLLLF